MADSSLWQLRRRRDTFQNLEDEDEDERLRFLRRRGNPAAPASAPPPHLSAGRSIWDIIQNPVELSPEKPGIWDFSGRGLGPGNVTGAIINSLPIPLAAKAINQVGRVEHQVADAAKNAFDWAFMSPEVAPAAPPAAGRPVPASITAAPVSIGGQGGGTATSTSDASISGGQQSASAYRDVIKGIESSGNYGALGPVTKSGDRAYGAYGVMGENIPSWTKMALGKAMTPEEFLASPEAQDKVFDYQFGQYLASGSPQDAASMWFTGKPLAESYGGPSDILGTSPEEYVNKFNRGIGAAPLPPSADSFQYGTPPSVPNPVDRPLPSAPDYSAANQFLEQARPQAPVLPDRFQALLSGLASANANTDTRGPGGFARLLANWGAGISGAAQQYDVQKTNAQNEYEANLRDFLLRRAAVAQSQENTLTDFRNAAGDITYGNLSADQQAEFTNAQNLFAQAEKNRAMGFETGQTNEERLYDYEKGRYEASQPQVIHSSDKGVTIQYPDGTIENRPFGAAGTAADIYNKVDMPDPILEVQKFAALQQLGDPQIIREEVLRDLVKDGTARQVFGEETYQAAVEEAMNTVNRALAGDPEVYQAALQNAIAANLLARKLGNDEWLPNAVAMGSVGARFLPTGP